MHVGTLTSSFQETWQLASKYSFLMQSVQANLRIQFEGCSRVLSSSTSACSSFMMPFEKLLHVPYLNLHMQYWNFKSTIRSTLIMVQTQLEDNIMFASKGSMIHPYPLIGNYNLYKVSSGLVTSYLMLMKQCALTTAAYKL